MPPAFAPVLPDTAPLVMVKEAPAVTNAPPPLDVAWLLVRETPLATTLPVLITSAPPLAALPLVRVRLLRFSVFAFPIETVTTAPPTLPLMIVLPAPAPT